MLFPLLYLQVQRGLKIASRVHQSALINDDPGQIHADLSFSPAAVQLDGDHPTSCWRP